MSGVEIQEASEMDVPAAYWLPQTLKICANPSEEPMSWSVILESGSDITVKEVYIHVPVATRVDPKADNAVSPRMWLEGVGRLTVSGDVAYIDSL